MFKVQNTLINAERERGRFIFFEHTHTQSHQFLTHLIESQPTASSSLLLFTRHRVKATPPHAPDDNRTSISQVYNRYIHWRDLFLDPLPGTWNYKYTLYTIYTARRHSNDLSNIADNPLYRRLARSTPGILCVRHSHTLHCYNTRPCRNTFVSETHGVFPRMFVFCRDRNIFRITGIIYLRYKYIYISMKLRDNASCSPYLRKMPPPI